MLYTDREQDARAADVPRGGPQERRTFARRIDCDEAPRRADSAGTARGGTPREHDPWEPPRRGYDG